MKTEINAPTSGQNRFLDYSVKVGNVEVEYCNDILKNMCDTLIEYKQLHAFRYIPLKNLFTKRENLHRKIELHAALYIVKKIFISDPSGRPSHLKQAV